MNYKISRTNYSGFILLFVALKVILNLLAMSHFGFHRDELLHLALGDHLDWGYKEVPPFIALLAYITIHCFGPSVFAARIFTTICAGLIVWFTGQITAELSGRKFAIALACLVLIFAPAFAASDYLFQPVVFDQFWWVLAVWLLIKYLNTGEVKYLYFLGATVGFGMLTKYSMAFFAMALILAVLMTKQRRVLFNKHVIGAVGLALFIFLPNIIWQFAHHLPFITHMKTLQKEQLDYNHPMDFVVQQLLVNGVALLVWVAGFFFLLFSFRLRPFQFLAFAYVFIFIFLLLMNGKSYYLFGAYPMLFAAGGFAFERMLKTRGPALRTLALLIFIIPNLLLFPLVLPFLTIKQTLAVFNFTHQNLPFMKFVTTWEDHQQHATTQDYADMFGWEEYTQKIAVAYHALTPAQQQQTFILAHNYGQAAAIHHYHNQYHLPDVVSLSSSFALWAPASLNAHYIIYINGMNEHDIGEIKPLVQDYKKIGEIEEPLAREKGTGIFLLINPKPALFQLYHQKYLITQQE